MTRVIKAVSYFLIKVLNFLQTKQFKTYSRVQKIFFVSKEWQPQSFFYKTL